MRKSHLLLFFSLGLMLGCKSATEPGPNYNFFPLTVGSQWSYSGDDAYTKMVVSDTTIGGKQYAIVEQDKFNPKISSNQYLPKRNFFRKDGNTIYILRLDTLNTLRDFIYVDPSAGASGSYYTITPIGNSERLITYVTYSNLREGFQDTVDGKIYANVLLEHIRTEILQGTKNIVLEGDFYFADGVGLINDVGNPTEELITYLIK